MGRREEKREATRQEILSAAAELFRTKGYEATSVDDIVLAANMAKGTFYYHFQAKEQLLLALQEAELAKAAGNARSRLSAGESPQKVLLEFIADATHWTEANSEVIKAMFKEKFARMKESGNCPADERMGPPQAIKMYLFDLIIEILSAGQKAGEIRDDLNAVELSRIVIPFMMSMRMSWLFDKEGSLSEISQRAMLVLLEGLRPRC